MAGERRLGRLGRPEAARARASSHGQEPLGVAQGVAPLVLLRRRPAGWLQRRPSARRRRRACRRRRRAARDAAARVAREGPCQVGVHARLGRAAAVSLVGAAVGRFYASRAAWLGGVSWRDRPSALLRRRLPAALRLVRPRVI
eukprot:7306195-Prymnesium_polylepis.1